MVVEDEKAEVIDPNVGNILGTSKVTRSGRVFSLNISTKAVTTPFCIINTESPIETRSKEQMTEPT